MVEVKQSARGIDYIEPAVLTKKTTFCRACLWRILNRSYSSLTIMTYDHVLDRARKILAVQPSECNRLGDSE